MILVPPPGIKPVPPAVEVWIPKHWTARRFPRICLNLGIQGIEIWGIVIPSVPPLILAPQDLLCAGALSPLLLHRLTPPALLCPLHLSLSALTQMFLLPKVQLVAPCWVDSAEWERFSEFP